MAIEFAELVARVVGYEDAARASESANSPSGSVHQSVSSRPASRVDPLQAGARELRGDLGPHLLAALEGDGHPEVGEADELAAQRTQADVDEQVLLVEERDVLEGVEVEVGAEPVVQDREHVVVELGRDSGSVVVGGLERPPVLDQVGAQEEAVVGLEQVRDPAQEAGALLRLEVADRAAEEGDQPRAARAGCARGRARSRRPCRGRRSSYSSAIASAVVARDLLGDVDRARRREGIRRRASRRAARGSSRPSPEPSSISVAGPPRRVRDAGGVALEDRPLRARRVVLRQSR